MGEVALRRLERIQTLDTNKDIAGRIEARLERLSLSAEEADRLTGLHPGTMQALAEGRAALPRGQALQRLAATLEADLEFLLGLEPGDIIPAELLQEAQGELGLLSLDEEALLQNYRKLDVSARAAFALVLARAAGMDAGAVPEKPHPAGGPQRGRRRGG